MSNLKAIKVIGKRREELLQLNRRVIDELPDLIAIVGDDYRFRYVNPAYARIHRLSVQDLTGRHVREFLGSDVFETIVRPNMDRCMANEIVHYESWFDFREAGVFYMDVRYIPLSGPKGRIDRITVIARDITGLSKPDGACPDGGEHGRNEHLMTGPASNVMDVLSTLHDCLDRLETCPPGDERQAALDEARAGLLALGDMTYPVADGGENSTRHEEELS